MKMATSLAREPGLSADGGYPMAARNHNAVCLTLWFAAHNNPRHDDLYSKLDAVVRCYKVTLSRHRILRGLQFRAWHLLSQKIIYPGALRYLARRYDTLLTADYKQIPAWPRRASVVVDMDDALFSPTEARFLNLPQVKAVVVTSEKAKTNFEQLGVARPICVIPQGVSIERIDPDKIQAIGRQHKGDGDVVIGFHAPTLTLSCDGPGRARNGMDDLDFLFDTISQAREAEPRITLWLLGVPSKSVEQYAAGKPWIKIFGYVPFWDVLNYVSNFDIGAYGRTCVEPVRFRVKIAEYMACGIPVVSTAAPESFIVKEASCGVVCSDDKEFSQAIVRLARSGDMRRELAMAGRSYAQTKLDWSVLLPIYKDVLAG